MHGRSAPNVLVDSDSRRTSTSGGMSGEEASPVSTSDSPSAQPVRVADKEEKHPLQNKWTLWVLIRDQSVKDDWHGSQTNVREFGYVEDFWRIFKNIKRPSKLGIVDFSCFKKDIAPAWEDETCGSGGRWIAKLEKVKAEELDELWLTVVLNLIGENFEEEGGDCICGAVVSSRSRSVKVALWLSEKAQEKVTPLGTAFRKVLQDTVGFAGDLAFEDFSKSKGNGSTSFTLAASDDSD
eukprot:TRINITY_DN15694_c0_g1_i1.p1 TRINITY_DN15694_c0_g1~~TRINITY_DN15694_c0_g1_i1.p1  ORF type:complete len:238 (-),score=62.34 TRINITY_DN15694_c0_g1_i1:92-805(-)